MPTKESVKPDRDTRLTITLEHSTVNEGRNLIRQLFHYENAAREHGVKTKMSLTARDFLQAELVADLIRLSLSGLQEIRRPP